MVAGSAIGFALAFVAISWGASALAAAAVRAGRDRLAAAGPAVERRAAALALGAPPLLAVIAVVAVALTSTGAGDHCLEHGGHLHLCLAHGGAWATRPLAVGLVAGLGTLAALAVVARARDLRATRRVAALLRRAGEVRRVAGIDVIIAPSPHRLAFTAGLRRGRVYLSSAVWGRLGDDERRALLAHEVAHVRGHDVAWGLVLAAAARLGAPRLAGALRARWRAATERLRDHEAARLVGDPAVVGAALVSVARVPAAVPLAGALAAVGDADLTDRVTALLAGGPDGVPAARRLGRAAAVALVAVALALIVHADPVHHALETALAVL